MRAQDRRDRDRGAAAEHEPEPKGHVAQVLAGAKPLGFGDTRMAVLELFRGLGTMLWEERAEAELRATGETARKRDPSTLDQLTPQELQIAGLVAEGLTNRDIAARLYPSPRTIDYHLRKVFTKLGIGSRTELVRHGLPERKPA